MARLAFLLVAVLATPLLAQDVTHVDVTGLPDGEYPATLTVKGGKLVDARPLSVRTIKFGGGNPVPDDPTPLPTAFAEEVRKQTAAVLQAGGSKTTGAALSAVYSLVGSGVADGSIASDKAFAAVKAGSDAVMASQADRDKWTAWRTSIGTALTTLQSQGQLATKEQISGVLKEIAAGMDAATGNEFKPGQLVRLNDDQRANMIANGILDGIDLAKLIELIKLVMELLKLFGGAN